MDAMLPEAIERAGFTLLGGFAPVPADGLAPAVRTVLLIGNAGPAMFERFRAERADDAETLDAWTRRTVDGLARALDAVPVYPFDRPYPPMQAWARRAGAGHASPLGLNIHPRYGLWHAYRAALSFARVLDVPSSPSAAHPCESCVERPCLRACPVQAFTSAGYDTAACGGWLAAAEGADCMERGCRARHACPVGQGYAYAPAQAAFHMRAFRASLTAAG
jgi:hypothetical protein